MNQQPSIPPAAAAAVAPAIAPATLSATRRQPRLSLAALNPLNVFVGPVFWRDVRIVSRKPLTFWARSVFALVLVALGSTAIWGTLYGTSFQSGTQQLEQAQQIAPGLTLFVMWVQFVLLNLSAPTMTGPAFIEERTKRTLDTLALTPLPALSITGSKFASRLLWVLILALIPVPLLLTLRVFGGIDAGFIVQASLITLTSASAAAAAAMLCSCFAQRSPTASAFGMMVALIMNIAPFIADLLFYLVGLGSLSQFAPSAYQALAIVSPGYTLFGASWQVAGGPTPFYPWWTNIASNLTLTLFFVALTSLRLPGLIRQGGSLTPTSTRASRRAAKAELAQAGTDASLTPEDDSGTTTAADARRRRSGAPRAVGTSRTVSDHPVLWRELRQTNVRHAWARWLVAGLCFLVIVLVYVQAGPDTSAGAITPGIILALITLFAALSASTGAIAGEAEARTLSSLLNTPLTPSVILGSKVIGAMRRCLPVFGAFCAHLVFVSFCGGIHPVVLLLAPIALASGVILLCCTGLLLSLVCKRSASAATNNILLVGLFWIGIPLGTLFLSALISPFRSEVVGFILFVCNAPAVTFTTLYSAAEAVESRGFAWYVPAIGSGMGKFIFTVFLSSSIHVLLGLLALAYARVAFYRHALRTTA